jgi:hypothetical protein
MATFLIILVISIVAAFIILIVEAKNSPMGYEDEDGFHYGTPDKKDDQ